jgi:hypothetical protein
MNVSRALVGLYPRPFRERWGSALEGEARAAGWRSWPDLVITMLGLWIHPAVWPAASVTQRRVRAATLTIAVTAFGWLTGHAVLEMTSSVPRGLAHSWVLNLCDMLTFLGFALVVPLPRLRRHAVADLVELTARRLVVPVMLGGGVVAAVNSGANPDAWPFLRSGVIACWWGSLALGTLQVVRTVADLDLTTVTAPGPRRLRLGLWLAALGLTLSGSVILVSTIAVGNDNLAGIAAGAGLVALAIASTGTVRDLSELSEL